MFMNFESDYIEEINDIKRDIEEKGKYIQTLTEIMQNMDEDECVRNTAYFYAMSEEFHQNKIIAQKRIRQLKRLAKREFVINTTKTLIGVAFGVLGFYAIMILVSVLG